jgi:N-acetyltransferase
MTAVKSEYQQYFPDGFTLETPRILLRLVKPEDFNIFLPLAADRQIWTYWTKDISDEAALRSWIEKVLNERAQQIRVPFTVIDKHTYEICGSISFVNISFYHKVLEIGSVWLGTSFMGTGINREVFFALLSYSFEVMKMERVELRVDNQNERGKAAFLKAGMIPEGVLRSNQLVHGNRRRDTLYFSVLRSEWQERKMHFYPEML